MSNIIFSLDRKSPSVLDPRETDPRKIVKSIDPIQIKGECTPITKIENNELNRVCLSIRMINIDSVKSSTKKENNEKNRLIKNFVDNYLFPITKIDKEFIKEIKSKYPLIESLNFSFESLFMGSICQTLMQAYLTIISWVLGSFWRFEKKALWNDLLYFIEIKDYPSIEFRGFILLKKNWEKLILINSETKDFTIKRMREVHIDNETIKTNLEEIEFDLKGKDYGHIEIFLYEILKKHEEDLSDYYCFLWTQKSFEDEDFNLIESGEDQNSENADDPMLDFIGSLLNDDWRSSKNVKINSIDDFEVELDIDFDILAKKKEKEELFIMELKQRFDITKSTGLKDLIAFCGRLMYLNGIIEEKFHKKIKIIAYFITTSKINSNSFDLKENIELNIIDSSNLDKIFLIKDL